MKQLFFFLAYIQVVLANLICQQNVCIANSDGCTVPPFNWTSTGNELLYRSTFIAACVRHDVCYACGKGKWSQLDCDTKFRNDMDTICTKAYPLQPKKNKGKGGKSKRGFWDDLTYAAKITRNIGWLLLNERNNEHCMVAAETYHLAVMWKGWKHYPNQAHPYCVNDCENLGEPTDDIPIEEVQDEIAECASA